MGGECLDCSKHPWLSLLAMVTVLQRQQPRHLHGT